MKVKIIQEIDNRIETKEEGIIRNIQETLEIFNKLLEEAKDSEIFLTFSLNADEQLSYKEYLGRIENISLKHATKIVKTEYVS